MTYNNDKNEMIITFDHEMNVTSLSKNDLSINVISTSYVSTSWTGSFINSTALKIKVKFGSMLTGGEVLELELRNYRAFRAPTGGWVRPDSFNATLESSLKSSAESAEFLSNFTGYAVFASLLAVFGVLVIWGVSTELIWSVINTLQLVTYLPLMIPYYPDHVKIMFKVLQFVNMDIKYTSNLFTQLTGIDGISTGSFNTRFTDNGIDSPMFLQNCSSLIMSLMFTIMALLSLIFLKLILWKNSWRDKLNHLISGYFFNNFLRFFNEGYLEIMFGATLNIAALTIGLFAETISFVISFVTGIMMFVYPFISAAILYDKRTQIAAGNEQFCKRFGTMFDHFKLDHQWYLFQYYPLFLIRRLIFVILLIVAIPYPELQ